MHESTIIVGSKWIAKWSQGRPDAFVWTVSDITEHGVYFTSPGSRSPGHLLALTTFARDYVKLPNSEGTKACGCGRVLRWSQLPLVGMQDFDDGGPAIEMRNCECGSTLAVELPQ